MEQENYKETLDDFFRELLVGRNFDPILYSQAMTYMKTMTKLSDERANQYLKGAKFLEVFLGYDGKIKLRASQYFEKDAPVRENLATIGRPSDNRKKSKQVKSKLQSHEPENRTSDTNTPPVAAPSAPSAGLCLSLRQQPVRAPKLTELPRRFIAGRTDLNWKYAVAEYVQVLSKNSEQKKNADIFLSLVNLGADESAAVEAACERFGMTVGQLFLIKKDFLKKLMRLFDGEIDDDNHCKVHPELVSQYRNIRKQIARAAYYSETRFHSILHEHAGDKTITSPNAVNQIYNILGVSSLIFQGQTYIVANDLRSKRAFNDTARWLVQLCQSNSRGVSWKQLEFAYSNSPGDLLDKIRILQLLTESDAFRLANGDKWICTLNAEIKQYVQNLLETSGAEEPLHLDEIAICLNRRFRAHPIEMENLRQMLMHDTTFSRNPDSGAWGLKHWDQPEAEPAKNAPPEVPVQRDSENLHEPAVHEGTVQPVDIPLDAGPQKVLKHIEKHGSISESEAAAMLGGARKFRRFSLKFEEYKELVPFDIRIEHAASGKRYVKQGR